MIDSWSDRTERLLGVEACDRLRNSRVFVAGVGGVGGYALEMLCRTGVGSIVAVDSDSVDITNLNRQILSLRSNIGEKKAKIASERCHDINPEVEIISLDEYISEDNAGELLDEYDPDFVIDAIDTVKPKCALVRESLYRRKGIVSSMGAGGRIHPEMVGYCDLWDTCDDGLAKAVRTRLKKDGVRGRLMTVWSSERPIRHELKMIDGVNKLTSPGTIASVPAVFGIFLANYALLKLVSE